MKAAIDAKDDRRIVEYGERVLAREPDDAQILEKVIRAMLVSNAKDTSERALKYAKHYEEMLSATRIHNPPGHLSQAQWHEEVDKGLSRALAYEARGQWSGQTDDAMVLSRRGYEIYPSAESAREVGKWLAVAGKEAEAVNYYADAFSIADSRNTDADRAKDRTRLGDIYRSYGRGKAWAISS